MTGPLGRPPRGLVSVEPGRRGEPVLMAVAPTGRTALTSAYDPAREAEGLVEAVGAGPGETVIVIGLALGHHLGLLLDGVGPEGRLIVIEPMADILTAALQAVDLSAVLGDQRLELIVETDPDRVADRLARLGPDPGGRAFRLAVQRASARAFPQVYGPIIGRLTPRPTKPVDPNRLGYAKFKTDRPRVLVAHGKYLLLREIMSGLGQAGAEAELLWLREREAEAEAVIGRLSRAVERFRPDFVLTVNHLGFDLDGLVAGFLERAEVPAASWHVDSPLLIIRHHRAQASPWVTIFLWDSDYIDEVRALGYQAVEYLPLATDPTVFNPRAAGAGRFGPFPVAFVGNSMTKTLAQVGQRLNIPADFYSIIDRAAELFTASPDRFAQAALERAGALEHPFGRAASSGDLIDLEAMVIRRATQVYRLRVMESVTPTGLTIAGDNGWAELTDQPGLSLHRPVNYYDDLPAFFGASDINLNATSLQMKTGLNQRVFDAPACGRFLLTDWRDQLADLFDPQTELAAYASPEEAKDKVRYYLDHPDQRERVAGAAHRRVMAEHTYRHRFERMFVVMRQRYG